MSEAHKDAEREALLKAASALEDEYMAVAQGAKKPSRIALEPMVKAVQELRKAAEARAASPQAPAVDGAEATTVYDPAYVREKFADYQRQIDGLKEELAHITSVAATVPEGWKLVPLEPSNKMTAVGQSLRYQSAWSIGAIYREMLAATPAAESKTLPRESEGIEPEHPEISSLEIGAPGNDPYSNLAAAAQAALNLIQVCIEGDGDTTDEGDMLRSALKIAALPHSTAHLEGQITHLIDCVREDVLAHDGKIAGRSQLAENRLKVLIGMALKDARSEASGVVKGEAE